MREDFLRHRIILAQKFGVGTGDHFLYCIHQLLREFREIFRVGGVILCINPSVLLPLQRKLKDVF